MKRAYDESFASYEEALAAYIGTELEAGTVTAAIAEQVTDAATTFPSSVVGALFYNETRRVVDRIVSATGSVLVLATYAGSEADDAYTIRTRGLDDNPFSEITYDAATRRYSVRGTVDDKYLDYDNSAAEIGAVSVVVAKNSTTTLLGGGESFVGEWADTLAYGIVVLGVVSDQDSAVDGLVVEWSHDETTVIDSDWYTLTGGASGKVYSWTPSARYYRISYTNGAVAQGTFVIQTLLRQGFKASSHRVNDSIVDQDDAELVKAVIAAMDTTSGLFQNVRSINGGSLMVSAEPRGYSIAKNLVPGKVAFHVWGYNPTVGATWETVRNTSTPMPYLVVADTFTVISGSVEDDPAKGAGVPGTGCHSVTLYGLDAAGAFQSDTFPTNGMALATSNLECSECSESSVALSGLEG